MQVCCTCRQNKLISDYHKDKSRKTGISPRCKECKSKTDKVHRSKNIDKIRENDKKYRSNPVVKEKARIRSSLWYYDNHEYAIQYRRIHYRENIEQYNLNRRKWYEKNPDFKKTYFKMYNKIRKERDPEYALRCNISQRIRQSIKNNKIKASRDIERLCGCSLLFMKQWIEYQFLSEHTWENHGKIWHFDHVKPMSSFNLENENDMKRCFHWSNLQPLGVKENLKKGSKIIDTCIKQQQTKAILYELKMVLTSY